MQKLFPVIAIRPLLATLPLAGFGWLLAGGLCYTLGVIFFVWKTMPFNHAVWHLFVMLGSGLHYACVLLYVIPPA